MNFLKQSMIFIKDILQSRELIFELTKNDFRKRYLGSYLGILWAFIQPLITIIVFWFVFQVGFKSQPAENVPFVLWLVSGIIAWFFFSETLSNATGSIIENGYLVNKVVFRVSILPIIKIASGLIIHLFFIGVAFLLFVLYGYMPELYWLQVFYYLFACIILLLGLSWITSSLVIFMKDIGQVIGVVLQLGFWATPIFWSFSIIPPRYQILLKLNPAFYIIEGYRKSFIYHKWFWQEPLLTLYFWIFTLGVLILGAFVFKKLRPHFADVL